MANKNNDWKNKRVKVRNPMDHNRPVYLFKNQRLCITKKPDWNKMGYSYLQIGSEEWEYAFRTLSKSAFGLWQFSMQNMNSYKWSLVPNYVCKHLGFSSTKTYHNAKKELIEKGFWIDNSEEGDDYRETICLAFPEMDTKWCDSTWEKGYEHDDSMDLYPWASDLYEDDYDVPYEQEAWERRW